MNPRLLEPTLFHLGSPEAEPTDRAPVLSGARCERDGTVVFPVQDSCPRCSGPAMSEVALPGPGTLWSWTVQHFAPKHPYRGPSGDDFVPYPLGYVDLGPVIVEARLQIADVAALRIGMAMTLTWLRVWTEPDGNDVLSYAFTPAEPAVSQQPNPGTPEPQGRR